MKAEKQGPVHAIASYTVRVRGEHGCMVTGDAALVSEQARCYLESRPNGTVEVYYSEQCGRCRGAGRVPKNRRTLTWSPCPICKGNPDIHRDELIKTMSLVC